MCLSVVNERIKYKPTTEVCGFKVVVDRVSSWQSLYWDTHLANLYDKWLHATPPKLMLNHLIFVYGTLKRGGWCHDILKYNSGVKFIGEFYTKPLYRLYSYHDLPCLVKYRKGNSIKGEVYEIDDYTLSRLDALEGVLYVRQPIQLDSDIIDMKGTEAYFYNRPITNEHRNLGSEYIIQRGVSA